MGFGGIMLPDFALRGNIIDPMQALQQTIDVAQKKQLADIALQAARSKGASYADVRIGRYLNQFVVTREKRVQNVANTESFGVGIRVIANGAWVFAATNIVTKEEMAKIVSWVQPHELRQKGEAAREFAYQNFRPEAWIKELLG